MKIFKTIRETREYISGKKRKGKKIGFVPTMGALHDGHLSLLRRALLENDLIATSIFVNPMQFNNPEDLKKYPRTLDHDIKKLEEISCDILFNPDVNEMYPEPVPDQYNFGHLDKILEGKFRPGHFNGVAVVVKRLFDIITPCRAYFGMKDYQQLRVIQTMVEKQQLPVEIVPCPTMREKDGLAMSSRNVRLTTHERNIAPVIYRVLLGVKARLRQVSVSTAREWALRQLNKYEEIQVEYFEIADAETLLPIKSWEEPESAVALTAVNLGNVRLIDNLILF